MSSVLITLMVVLALILWLVAAWFDSKRGWNLTGWLSGNCQNPFLRQHRQDESYADKDKTIEELKERIQVLEKIVTEPAYELNKKINSL